MAVPLALSLLLATILATVHAICTVPTDLVLLLDTSDSVGPDGWPFVQSFAKQLVAEFVINTASTSVAIIAFSSSATVALRFGDATNLTSAQSAIDGIELAGGVANVTQALLATLDSITIANC